MKTILCPTDFSDNARNALRYAVPFAERMKARLILLHVYPFPAVYAEAPLAIMDQETASMRAATQEHLLQLAGEVRAQSPGIACETLAVQGPVTGQVLSVARDHAADWIIMGTQGKTGLEKIIFGSITAQIMAQAECPVLGIPNGDFFNGIRRIAYATDYEESDIEALELLAGLAAYFDAEIVVLHVAKESDSAIESARFAAHAETIRQAIDYPKLFFHLIRRPHLQEALEEFMDRSGVDLLTMCSKKRGLFGQLFHGSETKKMAYHTKKPLLALHS